MKKHTLSVLVNDQPGVLQRVAGLFGRRGFNIDSVTVGNCEESGLSRMVIVTTGDMRTLEQIEKQLYKLIDVVRVSHLSDHAMVARELALIKVKAESLKRPEIVGIVDVFRASIVDIGETNMIIQAVGDLDKINAIIDLLRAYGIVEMSRTGTTALTRGTQR
ncbi:acetolactate synthase small subunit [Paenibacillus spongiae]|uniref:Acetolactate synthase small subunit n=1 Tax=Paenibacillus spongiae TaxID=2909671 RepID=A0ABY5S6W8_9BACL|nr:acetolactate synthase small subunit [Paenibacillus spongiae]UVI29661.1 acetolactate synthase small subunit [Paenibacillus spongiae]